MAGDQGGHRRQIPARTISRAVAFRLYARNEYDEAVARYESERTGLGLEFAVQVEAVLELVATRPALFRRVHGPVRRAIVKRFPYGIHFLDEPERVVVLAVFHAARDPAELLRRK